MTPQPGLIPTRLSGDLRRGGWLLDGYVDGDIDLVSRGRNWRGEGKGLAGYIDSAWRGWFDGHILADSDFTFGRYGSRATVQAGTADAFLRGESIQDISFAVAASPANSHEATSWKFANVVEHILQYHCNYIYDATGAAGSPDGWITEMAIDTTDSTAFEVFIVNQSDNMWRVLQQIGGGDEGGGDFHWPWFDRNNKFWYQLAPPFRGLTSRGTIDKSHLRGQVQVKRNNSQPGQRVGQVQLTAVKNPTTVYTAKYPASVSSGRIVKMDSGVWASSQTIANTRAQQLYEWLTRPYTVVIQVDPGLVLFETLDLSQKITLSYAGSVEDATTGHGMTLDLSGDYFIYKMDVSFNPADRTATATIEMEADN